MEFKIPPNYQIAGVKHDVQIKKGLGANDMRRGASSYFDRVCQIDADLVECEKRRAFIHEVLHHIDDIFDTRLKETHIKRLAIGINELIQQLEE